MPTGLGEPCFDKLEAVLAHAMMSIPSTKAFSIGSGFGGCQVRGSRHNDSFLKGTSDKDKPRLTTKTNNSGGVQGGISNGAHIFFDVGFKPPATIGREQSTADYGGEEIVVSSGGRHDPCVVSRGILAKKKPADQIARAIPIVEAMAALTILDAVLVQRSRTAMRTRWDKVDM